MVAAPDCSKVPNSHLASGACVCNTGFNTTAFGCLAPTTVVQLPSTSTGVAPAKSTNGSLVCTGSNVNPTPQNGKCVCNGGYVETGFGCQNSNDYCKSKGLLYNATFGCVNLDNGFIAKPTNLNTTFGIQCNNIGEIPFKVNGQCTCASGYYNTPVGCFINAKSLPNLLNPSIFNINPPSGIQIFNNPKPANSSCITNIYCKPFI